MVKKEIIEDVLKALRRKGDPVSLDQCRVIENRWTDIEVFNHYLAGKSDGERNMVTYWACRDAAQFVHGQLDVSALIPEMEVTPSQDEEPDNEPGMVTLSRKEFNSLLRRIEKLERWLNDYVQQSDVCRLTGFDKKRMRGCVDRGEIKAWTKGRYVFYRRKDVESFMKKVHATK